MATFMLIHGSWHGAWCWELLETALRQKGHRIIAPDLPGMGNDPTPLAAVSLEGWAKFVVDLARTADNDVVLVGHSRGGAVISQAAELEPTLFRGLVYVTGILLADGQQVMDLGEHMSTRGFEAITPSEDGLSSRLDPAQAISLLYNTTPAERATWAAERLGIDANAPNLVPLTLTAERYGAVPRAYVECTEDQTLSLDLQRLMQAKMPCDPVITLTTDHSPFLSAPEDLAQVLDDIAKRLGT